MHEGKKPCRCLLLEAGQADMARTVAEYVAGLDDSVRTPEEEYRARLSLCQDCPELMNGTCRLCGCYVETRAAKKGQQCPMVPARWSKIE
ncbi:MAG: hypothetical protein IKL25_07065 [Clostridia bacterium]|nr:hypothetical protein [Clostridia bacterium]